MGAYEVHGFAKRDPRATSLAVHDRDHQLRGERPNEDKTDRDKRGQRNTNPKPNTGFSLIAPGDKRHNQDKPRNHDHRDDYERHEQ